MKTCLIDLSAIFRRFWHASESEELNFSRRKTLGLISDTFHDFDEVKICVDCPPYKRKEMYPEYKANRPSPPPMVMEELRKCKEETLQRGASVLTCPGAEADDIIATYCILSHPEEEIVIYGCDKDLLQIDMPNVTIYDPFSKVVLTAGDKLGVKPHQVVDMLSLWGDSSDNIPGVKGIGKVTAATILGFFPTMRAIVQAIENLDEYFVSHKAHAKGIMESRDSLSLARKLITLDTNCEIKEEKMTQEELKTKVAFEEEAEVVETETVQAAPKEEAQIVHPAPATTHIIEHEKVSYTRALEPMDSTSAWKLAKLLFGSRQFTAFKSEEHVLAVMLRGRSLGIDAVTSLEEMNVIQGKTQMSATLMAGLCMRSSVCEYFEMIESTSDSATYETKRVGNKNPTKITFTMEDAERLGLPGKNQEYKKQPATMLRHRCASTLARIVYPDITAGVYTPDEIESFSGHNA